MATLKSSRVKEFDAYWNSINRSESFLSTYALAYDAYFEGLARGLILAGADKVLVEELMGSLKEYKLGQTLH